MTSSLDPDAAAALESGLFGLSSTPEGALVHVIVGARLLYRLAGTVLSRT
jgi:hypothetical protein